MTIGNVNPKLLECLNTALTMFPAVRQLSLNESSASIAKTKEAFDRTARTLWWWEGLKPPYIYLNYKSDPHSIVRKVLPPDEIINCYITDDELPPCRFIKGQLMKF